MQSGSKLGSTPSASCKSELLLFWHNIARETCKSIAANYRSFLQAFVKQHHTTGLVWNSKGGDAKTLAGGSATPGGSGPILPPPPPPKGLFDDIKIPKQQDPIKTARNALFAELNQGDAITKGKTDLKIGKLTE